MHEQLVEAQKRLQIAKDAYEAAIHAIEGQYVKRLLSDGAHAADVAALRAQYTEHYPMPDAVDRVAIPGEVTAKTRTRTPRARKAT